MSTTNFSASSVPHLRSVDELAATPGPFVWENMRRAQGLIPRVQWSEMALVSDAKFTGVTSQAGPYQLFNASPEALALPEAREALIVRSSHFYRPPLRSVGDSDADTWLKADEGDELAALISLAAGARVQYAGLVRKSSSDDLLGFPVRSPQPLAPLPSQHHHAPMIPQLGDFSNERQVPREVSLEKCLGLLKSFGRLDRADADALARAAKHYSVAIWFAEQDPELAWMQLISAIEVAATSWHGTELAEIDALAAWKPELIDLLRPYGDESVSAIASELSDITQATQQFVSFCEKHLPAPPIHRPARFGQVDWKKMPKWLGSVYDHRNRARSAGKSFPDALLAPPALLPEAGLRGQHARQCWSEKPLSSRGLVAKTRRRGNDAPMLLSTFEYITRNVLLSWATHLAKGIS